MRILHGVDLVEIGSVSKLLDEQHEQFLQRCFLPQEIEDVGKGVDRPAKFASRFAAKEAVMKALGTGFSEGIGFLDIEVKTAKSGSPSVKLHGRAAEEAMAIGVSHWTLSLSHEADYALASVIGMVETS